MRPRVPALVAALALFAMLIPLTTAVVLAWSPPSISSVCSNDANVHNWTVTLAHESNYDMQWADNSGFVAATNVTMVQGTNALSTSASVTTLYLRWASDHNSSNSATWSGGLCSTPAPTQTQVVTATPVVTAKTPDPTQTPFESFQGETATPVVSETPFESFQGETATPGASTTPPPTNSSGDSSNGGSTPLLALLICFLFGGAGLAFAQLQRRSVRI